MKPILAALQVVRDECTLARDRMRRKDISGDDRALARAKYLRLKHVLKAAEDAIEQGIVGLMWP